MPVTDEPRDPRREPSADPREGGLRPPATPRPADDPGANTEMFRAFAERDEPEPARPVGAPFRIVTLLIGLAVFAAIVWLLLR